MDPVSLRHALHQNPETAFAELQTKAILLQQLADLRLGEKWTLQLFQHSTGILVEYRGRGVEGSRGREGSFKLFRADMDALPVIENTGCEFASQRTGYMHACGHDVHMAVLFGLIRKVAKDAPKRNLLFLFQPAEEGMGGAQSILSEGLIQRYEIEAAFALHVASELPMGTVSSKAGIFFGIPQEFDVRFSGQAAHVAFPEKGRNALQAGLEFMHGIQGLIVELSSRERVLFNIGKMQAGVIRNVIPDSCILEGTHRSLKPEVKEFINAQIHELAGQAAKKTGTNAKVELLCSYDPVVNNAALVGELEAACRELGYAYQQAETAMTGEDFGFFTTLYPGLLFWLGSGSDYPLHSDRFLPDDACIEVGIATLFALI